MMFDNLVWEPILQYDKENELANVEYSGTKRTLESGEVQECF